MPRASQEVSNARKEEIIHACASLYETMPFKDITMQEIAEATSFKRPAIYNYFHTKEEIFLALFQREYELWTEALNTITDTHEGLTGAQPCSCRADELAQELARSLEKRERLLKLLSMNLYDMEENSRLERLVEFKTAYGNSMKAVDRCLEKFCPAMTAKDRQDFIYAFFPFIYGVYPYAAVTDKQREAMKLANIECVDLSIYEHVYAGTKKLLGVKD